MVDGGGGLHGDGDGDGGGGHTVTVARSDDLMSPLVTGVSCLWVSPCVLLTRGQWSMSWGHGQEHEHTKNSRGDVKV